MDNISIKLLLSIFEHSRMNISNFIEIQGFTLRQFNNRLEKLNYFLKDNNLPEIVVKNNHFLLDSKIEKYILNEEFLKSDLYMVDDILRPKIIYLYVFIRKEEVSNYHLQWLLKVSKNTAFNDVKLLKELCLENHIQFCYTRKDGYHLQGTELDKRYFALQCINELLEYPLGKKIIEHLILDWNKDININDTINVIESILKNNKLVFPKLRLEVVAIYCNFLFIRKNRFLELNSYQIDIIKNSNIIPLVEEIVGIFGVSLKSEEVYYLGALILSIVQNNFKDKNIVFIKSYVENLICFVENKLAILFDKRDELFKSLELHMIPAFYRIVFNIPLKNPLLKRIMSEYQFIFNIVRNATESIDLKFDKQISNDEIAYLTMFFGGYLQNRKRNYKKLHAQVICPNGISASNMLKSQLKEIFPDFLWSINSYSTKDEYEGVDMIFSTIFMKASVPVYVTKPLLSIYEKNYLLNIVNRDFNIKTQYLPSSRSILEIIKKYATINNYQQLEKELVDYIYKCNSIERSSDPVLGELLTKEYIQFADDIMTWEEAITYSAKPLIKNNKIEECYVDAIIDKVNELGPYIHIGKGVAIPHARPEEGVNGIGMSFLKLANPVKLANKDEHKVDLFITLAAIDNTTHLKALSELTQILSNKDKMNKLKSANTIDEVLNLIN